MTWEDYGIAHAQYVDGTKKIVGEVKEAWRCWQAFANKKHLGDYTDKVSAQRAVEREVHEVLHAK